MKEKNNYSTTTLNSVLVVQFKDNQGSWTTEQLRSMLRTRFNGHNEEFDISITNGDIPVITIREK